MSELYAVVREYHLYNKQCLNLCLCNSKRIPHVQQTVHHYMSELYAVAREYHTYNKSCLIVFFIMYAVARVGSNLEFYAQLWPENTT